MWLMYGRRPLTRLELGLYSLIIAIAVCVFFDRLLAAMELAERSAMETTVIGINTAITVRLTYEMLNGSPTDLGAALTRNPFGIAKATPPNYLGEMVAPDLATLARGVWIYDLSSHELIYLPRFRRGLETTDKAEAIRFRLVTPNPARYMLVPTSKYVWN